MGLALTTIHTVGVSTVFIERLRKRPSGKSTHTLAARKAFDDKSQTTMPIPRIINDYNYYIGEVDIADQQRSNYMTQRKALRSWFPLFCWILDHACINAFRVGCQLKFFGKGDHAKFREFLVQDLLAYSTNSKYQRNCMRMQTKLIKTGVHNLVKMKGRRVCQWCSFKAKTALSSSNVSSIWHIQRIFTCQRTERVVSKNFTNKYNI